jgi:hypothetical protein
VSPWSDQETRPAGDARSPDWGTFYQPIEMKLRLQVLSLCVDFGPGISEVLARLVQFTPTSGDFFFIGNFIH